ncbi:histone lysine demethylase PHF8-like isoform X1 [Aphidius gifuensis]|uniref:histone lysine demethylase PHF8-like isoform X1 n=1 Tax=Aphidius gifuensis TaxID=684658 RepID=UPI001CDD0ADC|nr:histone lysine demethylase PHF8-like isoform X1 [Aphidius gifuensis]
MDDSISDCTCGHSYDNEQFMIQCDVCKKWYHGVCVSIKDYMSTDLDKYHCPRCESTSGPSQQKFRLNWHRHEYTECDAHTKPVQTGTPIFIKELKSRHFTNGNEIVKNIRGQQLTLEYLQTNGFETPIIIDEKDGLDMTLPSSNFSVYDVESYIGGDREMDVIDVARQCNIRMKLRDFVEYYNDPSRSRIFNVISLEFTNTKLSSLVEAPYIARQLDWVNSTWPCDLPKDSELKRPEIQKYCLMSVKDSFTDFHIDFGGTSVWYHVLRGEKIFYLIKPTPGNLQMYQQWMNSTNQSETFFGDQVDVCYKITVKNGQTMMIPTGWIHAVLTPVDSLVFGGNFIHSLNIPMQIKIYELERKMKTPEKFKYPGFETMNWFAAKKLLNELKQLNSEDKKCPDYFLHGVKSLVTILKQWNTDKDYHTIPRGQIPLSINSQKLLKELGKEIRHADRYLMTINPPKPERESKRKKKKPINKDFIDFDTSNKIIGNALKSKINKDVKIQDVTKKQQLKTCLKFKLPKLPIVDNGSLKKSDNKQKDPIERVKILSKISKKSPTVIRFKLGDNEVVRSTNEKIDIYENFHDEPSTNVVQKKSSIYDFHDGSNDSDHGGFVIDETPKRKKSKNSGHKKSKKTDNIVLHDDPPKNGIEELLKASAYTLPPTEVSTMLPQPTTTTTSSGRSSPSTREALEGMLSFSEQCYSTESVDPALSPSKLIEQVTYHDDEDDQSIENIDKVHQDDDFIYPALDASDDDDEYIIKRRGKEGIDEAWNPTARVGPLLPKINRPAREGVKKTCVEKGLEAAAAKRAKIPVVLKRAYKKQKKDNIPSPSKPIINSIVTQHEKSTLTTTSPLQSSTSFTSILTSPNRLKDVKAKLAAPVPIERKPRKGMKTAKQRLGKILKLHKMMH